MSIVDEAGSATPHVRQLTAAEDEGKCQTLSISTLLPADSPRLAGEDAVHTRILADSDGEFAPIVVHGATMRVIDGMHRLKAAMLRGEKTIKVRLFHGSEDAAFVLAVKANVAHGLPLSLADRKAVTVRILRTHPQWSDRAVAAVTGLSAKTAGAIRRQIVVDQPAQPRVGRDGRTRPVGAATGRQRASEILTSRPDLSPRHVARAAGVSVSTAHDVRDRLRRREDAIPPRQRGRDYDRQSAAGSRQAERRGPTTARIGPIRDRSAILNSLRQDPSLRFTEAGRRLVRWLEARAIGPDGWEELTGAVLPHCGFFVADLACTVADAWLAVAEHLRRRAETDSADGVAS